MHPLLWVEPDIHSNSLYSVHIVLQDAGEKTDTPEVVQDRREEGDGGPGDKLSPRPVRKGEREGDDRLAEERLKWLMEMENLRRECEQREESERKRCAEEVQTMRERTGVLEERCRVMTGEVEEGRMAKSELNKTRERLAMRTNTLNLTYA